MTGAASDWGKVRVLSAVLSTVLGLMVGQALAVTPDEAEEKYQRTLSELMDDLGNPERSFAFVEAATEKGDFYAAISSLERILLLRPALANIQMELGVLYVRVGATTRGRAMIAKSLKAPDVPPNVRARAEQILKAEGQMPAMVAVAAPRPTGPNVFYGGLSVGARHESNANAGPEDQEVLIGGNPGLLDRESLGDSDFIYSAAVSASYLRLFENRFVPRVALNAQYFGQIYDEFDNLNFDGVGIDVGPWLRLIPNSDRLEVRPYLSYANYRLDHRKFVEIKGAGLAVQSVLSDRDSLGLNFSAQDQAYDNSDERFVTDRNGDYLTLSTQYTRALTPNQYLALQLIGETADAKESFQSYDRYGIGLSYRLFVDGWIGKGKNTIDVSARTRRTEYDEADPQFGTDKREEDRHEFGIDWALPLLERVALTTSVQHTINDSNIANTDYDNTSVGMTLDARF